MQLGYRGSVNTWECDENDHLNVRFHLDRHWQTLNYLLPARVGAQPRLRAQHLRFVAEARVATPMAGYGGLINPGAADQPLKFLTELRHGFTGAVLSTCVHELDGAVVPSSMQPVALPEHAAPRGITIDDTPYAGLVRADAERFGFHLIGRGVVGAAECDADGSLQIPMYIGRTSDSMPHLWGHLSDGEGTEHDGSEGGAVLEYRLRFHDFLGLGQGFDICSGISSVGPKVQQFTHLIYRSDGQQPVVSAMAVAVRMDLHARKAVTLGEARLEALRAKKLLAPA